MLGSAGELSSAFCCGVRNAVARPRAPESISEHTDKPVSNVTMRGLQLPPDSRVFMVQVRLLVRIRRVYKRRSVRTS